MARIDGRKADDLRPVKFTRHFTESAPGSVLVEFGRTKVLCTASIAHEVPKWLEGKGQGWVTAEYGMLPGSTQDRKQRERSGKVDGRTSEIQRLIGRAMRGVIDMELLGEKTIWLDCDVLEADGGTRTAAINGALVALHDALVVLSNRGHLARPPLRDAVAAISVGIVRGVPCLDLDYEEDSKAEVDMNVVMTGAGSFVEIQGTGESRAFAESELRALLRLARTGIRRIVGAQRRLLGDSGLLPAPAARAPR